MPAQKVNCTHDGCTKINQCKRAQDAEAEISVLGSLMLDRDAIYRVVDVLSVQDFYKPVHRHVYEAIMDLTARHEPIDVLSVGSRLKEKGKLDDIGGAARFAYLGQTLPPR